AIILRLKDGAAVRPALTEAKLEEKGGGRWVRSGSPAVAVAWLEQAKVVVVASDETVLTAALGADKAGSFKTSPIFRPRSDDAFWLAADTGALGAEAFKDAMDAGSKLLAGFEVALGGGGKLDIEYTQLGSKVPRLGNVLAARAHSELAALPGDALLGIGLSLERSPGRTLGDVLNELGRAGNGKLASDADAMLQAGAKISLADLDRALGHGVGMTVYGSGDQLKSIGDLSNGNDIGEHFAMVADVATRDDKLAAGLVDAIGNALSVQKGFKAGVPGSFSLENAGISLFVNTSAGKVRIVFGATKIAIAARDSKAPPLSQQASFTKAVEGNAKESQLLVFADIGRVAKMLPPEMSGQMATLGDVGAALSVNLKLNEKGIDVVADSAGGAAVVAVIGSSSAVAIYGVRRYLANAKTSEAKNSLGAIARGAVGAFERETGNPPTHALCKSASPVPAKVPSGRKYQSQPGSDYDSGSETAGWKCLKFTIASSQYYQYDYRVGGDYKGPKRGGPNPGPDGFEASAEGDLDGDGVTSLFTLTGKVDKTTNAVRINPQLFIADELE
ncbi:MAG: hypothetical protein JNK04_19520, partial [Myxococcales bacterium]|nr:hypothetical protein [Myxococcales bacterium]